MCFLVFTMKIGKVKTAVTTDQATTEPLKVPPRFVSAAITPEAIRLPQVGGHDPYFGLTRSFINSLVLPTAENNFKPPVRSFVIRKRGAKTGVRLVDYKSLRDFILSHAETGTEVQGQTTE
jgi:hypothetical protein